MPEVFYQKDNITIYKGDCKEVLNDLQFDVIVSDPPYGISHPTNYHSRGRGKLAKCSDYAPVAGDNQPFDPTFLLNTKKPLCLFGANYFADKLPNSSGWLVWDKQRPKGLDQSSCELAWTNFVKGVRIFHHLWNGMLRASERGKGMLVHPTQKPIALMEWILNLKWTPKGTILDPYAGGGSTLIAAKKLGRPAIGVELSEEYCEIMVRRLEDICPQNGQQTDWGF